jgi:uncharacterized protein YkwD
MPFTAMRRPLLFAIVLVALSIPVSAAQSKTAATSLARRAALEREIVREVNRVRASHALRPLRFGDGLRTAAAAHSRAMVEIGFFEHESADGTSFDNRIRRYYRDRGWETWSVGEALLASSAEIDAHQVVAAWAKSRPHRVVLLSPTWRDAGIGVYYSDSAPGEFGDAPALVVTADFGLRSGRASSS